MPKYRVRKILTTEVDVVADTPEEAKTKTFLIGSRDIVSLDYEVEEIPPVVRYDGIIRIEGGFSRSGAFWESVKLDIESELQAMVDRLNAETVYEEFGFQVGEIEPTSEEVVE